MSGERRVCLEGSVRGTAGVVISHCVSFPGDGM